MKRRWIITLLLLPVVVLAVLFLTRNLHTVPPDECSDVYRQYKDTPGIKASFIKDYPLDDTTTIDVTMLQAQDSIIWKNLYVQILKLNKPDIHNSAKVAFRIIPKENQTSQTDNELSNKNLAAFSKDDLTIAFFHLETMQQYLKIIDLYFTLL
jgi:hypothetical protein